MISIGYIEILANITHNPSTVCATMLIKKNPSGNRGVFLFRSSGRYPRQQRMTSNWLTVGFLKQPAAGEVRHLRPKPLKSYRRKPMGDARCLSHTAMRTGKSFPASECRKAA